MNGLYRWAEDMLSENKNLRQKLKAELKEKRELEQRLAAAEIKYDSLVKAINEVDHTKKEILATSKNDEAVRKGYSMSGFLKHYEIIPGLWHKVRNIINEKIECREAARPCICYE